MISFHVSSLSNPPLHRRLLQPSGKPPCLSFRWLPNATFASPPQFVHGPLGRPLPRLSLDDSPKFEFIWCFFHSPTSSPGIEELFLNFSGTILINFVKAMLVPSSNNARFLVVKEALLLASSYFPYPLFHSLFWCDCANAFYWIRNHPSTPWAFQMIFYDILKFSLILLSFYISHTSWVNNFNVDSFVHTSTHGSPLIDFFPYPLVLLLVPSFRCGCSLFSDIC